jgi:uncharacterized membrane protein
MNILLKSGRIIFAIGMTGLGILCLIYQDFIVGRPPAWSAGVEINPALAYISGVAIIIISVAIVLKKWAAAGSVIIAVLILFLSLFRHVPQFFADWVNAYKAFALLGGALVIACSFLQEDDTIVPGFHLPERVVKGLLITGWILVSVFFIACGYAHFKWADGVQYLIPEFIPFRLFWTYFCGACLFAGAIGIIIPKTRRLASLLSGIMVLGWFFLLHIPRFLANPKDPSDRLGVFESFTFVGIFFVLAGIFSRRK